MTVTGGNMTVVNGKMADVNGSMTVIAGIKAAGDGEMTACGAMKGPGGGGHMLSAGMVASWTGCSAGF